MIKRIGYYVFAMFFTLFRIVPVNRNKIFLIATHDESDEGTIELMVQYIKEHRQGCRFVYLTKEDGIHRPLSFFFQKAFHMATAGVIMMDNVFMPMAYTPISKKVCVVQLWHGTGTIKKFGLDSDPEAVKKVSSKANGRITILPINGEKTKRQYQSAFGVDESRIYVTGLPRTDLIMNQAQMAEREENFYRQYPGYAKKSITLYAPTFRDAEGTNPTLGLDLDAYYEQMEEDEILFLRLHPHVAAHFDDQVLNKYHGKVVNMSHYPGVTTLLVVSDKLVTDYSSIAFEYALMNKPMFFYAYDLDEFEKNGRSFYEDYRKEVPGLVCQTQEDLQMQLKKAPKEVAQSQFLKENYLYVDGNARKRLFQLIFQ